MSAFRSQITAAIIVFGLLKLSCQYVRGEQSSKKDSGRKLADLLRARSKIHATLEGICRRTLAKISSPNTRVMYGKALYDFLEWWRDQGSPALGDSVVVAHKNSLIQKGYSASSVNQRLTAIRRLAARATEEGVLPATQVVAIQRIKGTPKVAAPTHLLTAREAEGLMNTPASTIKGQRDRALLALLVACGLRRNEIVRLSVDDLKRQPRGWGLVSVIGLHQQGRIVPLPPWVRRALDKWLTVSRLTEGPMFPAVERHGCPTTKRLSAPMVGEIVKAYGKKIGLKISPRNLRRTCAVLCRRRGADLEQIQMLLGHTSIQVTEQFVATLARRMKAPNGKLGLRWRKVQKLAS